MGDDRIPSPGDLAASVTRRVRDILATAERTAAEIRAEAEREAQEYLEDAIRRIDAFADGRARRIGAAGDELLAHVEALSARAERSTRLDGEITTILDALADAAAAIAAEARRPPIVLPGGEAPPAASADHGEVVRQIASALPRRPAPPAPRPRVVVPPGP